MATRKCFPYPLRDINQFMRWNRHRRHGSSNAPVLSKEFISLTDFQFYYSYLFKDADDSILKDISKKLDDSKNLLVYWTTKEMAEQNVGFMFYNTYNSNNNVDETGENNSKKAVNIIKMVSDNVVEDKVIDVEDFNNAKVIIDGFYVLHYIPTDYQYRFLKQVPNDSYKSNFIILKSWKETMEYLLTTNLLKHNVIFDDDYNEDNWNLLNEFYVDYTELMFNERKTLDKIKYNVVENYSSLRNDISVRHIIKVLETRIKDTNYRLYLFAKFEKYGGVKYGVSCVADTDKYYNYIDDDRLFYVQNNNYYFLDNGLNTTTNGKMYIVLDMFYVISDRARQILGNDNFVINASTYRFFYERYKHLMVEKQTREGIGEVDLIIDKYQKVLNAGKELKIEGLVMSKNKIEIPDQQFNMSFTDEFIDMTDKQVLKEIRTMIKNEAVKYNFNTFYERILRLSALKVIYRDNVRDTDYKDFKSAKFTLNNMNIEISKDARVRINDTYCRIEDVFEILNRTICYTSQEDYERYIKDVSYIGHKWKNMIGTGSLVKLYNPFSELKISQSLGDINLRFSYYWDIRKRSRIYLMLNNEKYEIHNKHHFIKAFNMPEQYLTIEEIKTELMECILGLEGDGIIELIKNAVKEGEIVKRRAEELVSKTVKDIKAEKVEINIRGAKKIGYIFKGRLTNAEFFVDTNTLDVFKKVNDEWNRRCVVNDSNKNRIFEDWLANRLVNVYNEPVFIHTLHNT